MTTNGAVTAAQCAH